MSKPEEVAEPVAAAEDAGNTASAPEPVEAQAEAPAEPTPAPEPTAEERLRAQLNDTTAKLRTVSKAYTDLQAEMPEIRKRFELQAEGKVERKVAEAIEAFLDPVMNLRRSIEAGGDDPVAVKEGLQMVLHQFESALTRLGLVEVPGVGSRFDPDLHEALAVMPVTEKAQDGQVLVVYANGYQVRGRTLKAAQVVIGKYQEPAEA